MKIRNLKKEDISMDTLSEAIQDIDMNNYRNKTKRRLNKNSPLFSLPNCSKFSINIKPMDPLFKLFGLYRRMKPDLKFEAHKNANMNRFAENQIKRLEKLRSNPRKYWLLADLLMSRSSTFRTLAINQSFSNWYKNHSLGFILNCNRKVTEIIKKRRGDLDYKRVYIPKADNQYRPLGVWQPEWRLFLHLLNQFMVYFLLPSYLNSQHGFIPGRGTLSAWKDLFSRELLNKPYIYEFDLKNFFGEVRSDKVDEILETKGVPNWLRSQILKINYALPKLPGIELIEEDIVQRKAHHLSYPFMKEWNADETREWAFSHIPFKGLPQGSALSPTLSILVLNKFLRQEISLSYADDGLFFGDKEFKIIQHKKNGIILHPKKSQWVKFAGEWIRPMKFLGLKYDGVVLESQTRTGKNLILSQDIQYLSSLITHIESFGKQGVSWSTIVKRGGNSGTFKSQIAKFIQSRLYNGQYNLENLNQDFELKFNRSSWGNTKLNRQYDLDNFNASSYACNSLANIIKHSIRYNNRKKAKKN